MCGIVAIYAYKSSAPRVDHGELDRIRDYMALRGPDGKGSWYSSDGRVGLGHRRLSIIDLSERATQPMSTPDGRYTITYNGEIYNYKAIRRRLEAKGITFQSDSDTEVLLYLFTEKGEAAVKDLRGMFSFSVWDEKKQALFLARDPYGIKPLYYADNGNTFRAASQVRALLYGGRVNQTSDPAGIAGFFLFGSVPEPYTTFEAVHAVPAGGFLWVNRGGVQSPKTYFSIAGTFRDAADRKDQQQTDELQSCVNRALHDSVKAHLVADVPVGAFLSSGVDSGSLVGLMKDAGQQDLQAVTLGFQEYQGKPDDEVPLAELIAKQYGIRHTTHMVSEKEFHRAMPQILSDMDQPSIDGINTWFVSRAARETGLKVAVSGLGGDELFGGYPSFTDVPRWVNYFSLVSRIPFLGDFFRTLHSAYGFLCSGRNPKTGGLIKYGGSYPGAYLLRRGVFMPWELPEIMGEAAAADGIRRLIPLAHIADILKPDPKTGYLRVATMEASLYMRNQLLRDADWAGMAHGLEIRLPLVDSFLLNALAPFLIDKGQRNNKKLISGALGTPLPKEIVGRPKTGFTVPIGKWLQTDGDLDIWKRVPLLRNRGCHWSRRWAYTVAHLN